MMVIFSQLALSGIDGVQTKRKKRKHAVVIAPTRMVANNRFQAEFEPSFDGMREDPYDNQMGEASVDGRGCRRREMLRSVELIEMLEVPFSD